MINSMTGFGRYEVLYGERKTIVEMKSVNHRYLELGIKLPRKLNFLETEIRNEVKKYIHRGKVDIFVTYENQGEDIAGIRYNKALAKEYYDCYCQISEELHIDNDIKTSYIMRSPDVVTIENVSEDENEVKELILEGISGACKKLVDMRAVEGENLKSDLMSKLQNITEHVLFITEKSPLIIAEYREKNYIYYELNTSVFDELILWIGQFGGNR